MDTLGAPRDRATGNIGDRIAPYKGHKVTVFAGAKPAAGSSNWAKTEVGTGILDSNHVEIAISDASDDHYIIRLEVDTDYLRGSTTTFVW